MKTINTELCLHENTILKNKYKIKKVISVSNLSIVYLAEKIDDRKLFAIKEFFPKQLVIRDLDNRTLVVRLLSKKKQFCKLKEQFAIESTILKNLSHSNIVKHIDSFEENETFYIVMKYYEGLTLEKYIKERDYDKSKLYNDIFLPIINAINYIHKKGIIHRDIKPSNIIIDNKGIPYLIDFGSAIYYRFSFENNILTTSGYSPLELYAKNNKQGKFTDIYSLSATLYFSLTGVVPLDISKRIIEDTLKSVKKYNREVSIFFAFIIKWGLAVKSYRRCFSLKFFLIALYLENRGKFIFSQNLTNCSKKNIEK